MSTGTNRVARFLQETGPQETGPRVAMGGYDGHSDSDTTPGNRTAEASEWSELQSIARRIDRWRESPAVKLNVAQLLKRFPDPEKKGTSLLGHDKTYGVFCKAADAPSDYRITEWLGKYRTVFRMIFGTMAGADDLRDDLPQVAQLLPVITGENGMLKELGNKRFVLIEGESGAGKSELLRMCKARLAERAVLVTADPAWRSVLYAVQEMLKACGAAVPARHTLADYLTALFAATEGKILLIDEGHEACGTVLNIIKALINRAVDRGQAGFGVVLACLPSLWRKLTAAAREDVEQLLHNRLRIRTKLETLSPDDMGDYVCRRLGRAAPLPLKVCQDLVKHASAFGPLSFPRNVCDIARLNGGDVPAAITAAVADITATRKEAA